MCTAAKADTADMFYNMCYNCREPGHRWRDCSKPLRQGLQDLKDRAEKDDERLNGSGGQQRSGRPCPPEGSKGGRAGQPSKAPEVKYPPKSPYWNDDPRSWWLGPMNLSYAYIDGVRT